MKDGLVLPDDARDVAATVQPATHDAGKEARRKETIKNTQVHCCRRPRNARTQVLFHVATKSELGKWCVHFSKKTAISTQSTDQTEKNRRRSIGELPDLIRRNDTPECILGESVAWFDDTILARIKTQEHMQTRAVFTDVDQKCVFALYA